jgi:hypothetical protein
MRILFLDHPQFTSGSYLLWHGLNEVLGPGAVIVHPHIPTHYDADVLDLRAQPWFHEMEAAVSRRDLPQGIPAFAPGEGLTGGGETLLKRYSPGLKFPPPPEPASEERVAQELDAGRFDLAVLSNSHRVPTLALARLRRRVRTMPPIVYYDAGERDELNEHWIHVFRPHLVFKQILTPEVEARGLSVPIPGYALRMLPLPLSSPLADNPSETRMGGRLMAEFQQMDGPDSKAYDVFHWMGPTWPGRPPVVAALDRLCAERKLATSGSAEPAAYHRILATCRVAVTMRGSGRDTHRYWEIPLYRTLMLADGTMGCLHPYAFEDGKTAAFWLTLDDLLSKVVSFAERGGPRGSDRERIAAAGKAHLRTYHTTGSRAVFFLERVGEHVKALDPAARAAVDRWKESRAWDGRPWRSPAVGGLL